MAARDLSVSDDEAPASDPGEGGTPLAGDPAPQPLEEHPISLTWDLSDYPNAPVPGKEYPVSATLADGLCAGKRRHLDPRHDPAGDSARRFVGVCFETA